MRQRFFICTALLFGLQVSANAETVNHEKQYDRCMELVHKSPNKAFDLGVSWKALGGGEAAEHCISTAMVGIGLYPQAAERLEKLADDARQTKEFKAQILAQAGQAWFLAKDYNRAQQVLDTAIGLDETQAELYVDRAQIYVAQSFLDAAIEDLNKAIELDDMNVDAMVFRGSVHRMRESFEKAWADISRAADLDAGNLEALLERGMLHRINGKNDLARRDWLSVIELAPRSETARAARVNLEKMEVKPE